MKRNKLFITLGTVALGVAMVGIANAAPMADAQKAAPADSTRQQTYMTQENWDAMKKAMNIKVDAAQDAADKDANKDSKKNNDSKTQKDQSFTMGPQMMDDETFEQMNEFHKSMPQNMQMGEMQKSMTQQDMQKNMEQHSQAGGGMAKSGSGSMMGR